MARKNTVSSKNCFFVKNKPEIDTNWNFSSKITFVSWKTRRTREGGKKKEREGQKRRWGQTEKVNILFMFSKLRSFFYFIKYYYSSQSYNKETKHTHIHKSGKKRENLLFFCFRATKIVCLYNFFFFCRSFFVSCCCHVFYRHDDFASLFCQLCCCLTHWRRNNKTWWRNLITTFRSIYTHFSQRIQL